MSHHRFSRMELLVGQKGLDRLNRASVAVFGIGGVGSFATEGLVRAGVGRLTLIDFDHICLTNVNRQIHALEESVGRAKVQVMAERCRAINPEVQVEPLQTYYQADCAEELLNRGYDYVLDCIDHVSAKLHLIQGCRERGLAVISSMGAGNKLDPTQISVADLSQTRHCRLARIIRKELRRRGVASGVKVVYSTELFHSPDPPFSPDENGQQPIAQRKVILGSSSYIPPLFGLTMAGEVIRDLLGEECR